MEAKGHLSLFSRNSRPLLASRPGVRYLASLKPLGQLYYLLQRNVEDLTQNVGKRLGSDTSPW